MFSTLRLPHFCTILAGSLIVTLASGCGSGRPTTYPVTGTVTLDGKPIADAGVMLMPESGGRPASGRTGEDGSFTLKTFEPGDGALPGKYFVSVSKSETSGVQADPDGLSGPVGPGGMKEVWIIPKKYADAKKSGITVEVTADTKPLDLALTSK